MKVDDRYDINLIARIVEDLESVRICDWKRFNFSKENFIEKVVFKDITPNIRDGESEFEENRLGIFLYAKSNESPSIVYTCKIVDEEEFVLKKMHIPVITSE
jgi:hypothetical protein